MRVLVTGSSGQIGTNLALRLQADGHDVFGVDKRQNTGSRCVPDAPAGSRGPLPGLPRRHRRRRVPGGRPRRPPRGAREGPSARPRAAPGARERDHDVQRARVRARRSACRSSSPRPVRSTETSTGSRSTPRRRPTSPTRRARTRRRRSRARHSSIRTPAATGSAISSSASRMSTAATTATSGAWTASCRSGCTLSRERADHDLRRRGEAARLHLHRRLRRRHRARRLRARGRARLEPDGQPRLRAGQHARPGGRADRGRARRRAEDHACRRRCSARSRITSPTSRRRATCSAGGRTRRSRTGSPRRSPGSRSGAPRIPRKIARSCARSRPTRSIMASSSLPAPAPDVICALRPDRVGQDRRRGAAGRPPRRRPRSRPTRRRSTPGCRSSPRRRRNPTRLVGIVPLTDGCRSGGTSARAHAAIDESLAAGRRALVVGGTGLYLRAALSQLAAPAAAGDGERERWEDVYGRLGAEGAHALLAERDPAAAARVHPNDRKRVVRALELAAAGRVARARRATSSGATTSACPRCSSHSTSRKMSSIAGSTSARHCSPHAVRREEARRAWADRSPTRRRRCSGSRPSRRCPRPRRSRRSRKRRSAWRGTSASGCGASRASLRSMAADRRGDRR